MPNNSLDANDLRKLKRSELLEIMLAQSEEIDRLRKEVAEKDAELQDRTIKIQRSGSIAEASLALTRVFEEAQRAADLYLANVALGARSVGASPDSNTAPGADAGGIRGASLNSGTPHVPTVDPDATSVLAAQRSPVRQTGAAGPEARTASTRGKHFSN